MKINPDNDEVEVYQDRDGEWRWRRIDGDNGKILYASTEGYVNKDYAEEAAAVYNPEIPIYFGVR